MSTIERAYTKYCVRRFPSPADKDIVSLERRLRRGLPGQFRHYVLSFNGGFFNRPQIRHEDTRCQVDDALEVIYGVGVRDLPPQGDDAPTVYIGAELGTAVDQFSGNTPCVVLPIGYTEMGNMLLLGMHADDAETIYLKKAYSQQYWVLAQCIDEFFAALQDPAEE